MVTVKEAIKRLRLMADGGTNFSKESNEACRMGAEALKEIEKRGAVNCGQLCEWNTTAGCGKPNGVPCKMSNVTVAKNETVADVAPVVHGEWEDYHFVKVDCPKSGFPTVKCSVCEIAFCDLINNHHFMYHYCPNCGAQMDGERKGDDA